MGPVLREESEVLLKELRLTLEAERASERDRLEAQKRQDLERLKAESEKELQAETSRLQEERKEKLDSVKQEVSEDDAGQLVSASLVQILLLPPGRTCLETALLHRKSQSKQTETVI